MSESSTPPLSLLRMLMGGLVLKLMPIGVRNCARLLLPSSSFTLCFMSLKQYGETITEQPFRSIT